MLLAAVDLVCWAKLLGFTRTPELAHAEIATFRNLVLHVAVRITRGATSPGPYRPHLEIR